MKEIIPFCTLEDVCPYLKNKMSRTEYLYIDGCEFDFNSKLVKHGYRRFGRYFQKPICKECNECKSVRVDAFNFALSKSDKRVYKKNKNTKWLYSRPLADNEHIDLFRKYHKFMNYKKGWKYYDIDIRKYYEIYVWGYEEFGKEISYYDENGELICVDLIDIVDDGISSVYCYYDPDYANLSLGRFSLLKQIEFAKNANLKWIYLGYYVEGCRSLEYKKDYQPQEILTKYVGLDKEAIWC